MYSLTHSYPSSWYCLLAFWVVSRITSTLITYYLHIHKDQYPSYSGGDDGQTYPGNDLCFALLLLLVGFYFHIPLTTCCSHGLMGLVFGMTTIAFILNCLYGNLHSSTCSTCSKDTHSLSSISDPILSASSFF